MLHLAEILREKLPSDVFSDTEIAGILQVTPDARQGLVKRAMARGDIIQLRRGVYCFGRRFQHATLNLFELASRMYWPSYISLESALSYHGWIPEATYAVTSVSAKRSCQFENVLGVFSYTRMPRFNFIGVDRREDDRAIFLMATPAKALVDYVLTHKLDDFGVDALTEGLRIDVDALRHLSGDELQAIAQGCRSKRATRFARVLKRELKI
jgi:predicted transcriptional regulator of viral defense system